jgi:tetratricopeptide (TPR) repeat protein
MSSRPTDSVVRILLLLAAFSLSAPGTLLGQGATAQVAQLVTKAGNLSRAGDFTGAADLYRQAISINPTDPMLHFYLGLAYENNGSYADAAKAYDAAIASQEPKKTLPTVLLANLYLHSAIAALMTNQLDKANAQVDKALQWTSDNADALSTKGNILDLQGHLDQAIDYDRKAFAKNPKSSTTAQGLASVLLRKGNANEAVQVTETALLWERQ